MGDPAGWPSPPDRIGGAAQHDEGRTMIKRLLRVFTTPMGWLYAAAIFVVGSLFGVGLFTFGYANGAAYLSEDPKACINCHVMNKEYTAWEKSSHGKFAVCNDCHEPHNDLVGRLKNQALNGWNHSFAFTTGRFQDNMQITQHNRDITEKACLHCHGELTESIRAVRPQHSQQVSCISCHRTVGHM